MGPRAEGDGGGGGGRACVSVCGWGEGGGGGGQKKSKWVYRRGVGWSGGRCLEAKESEADGLGVRGEKHMVHRYMYACRGAFPVSRRCFS